MTQAAPETSQETPTPMVATAGIAPAVPPALPADFDLEGVRAALATTMVRIEGREVPIVEVMDLAQCRPGAPSGDRRPGQLGCGGRGFSVAKQAGQREGKLHLCGCATAAWRRASGVAPAPAVIEEHDELPSASAHIPSGAREKDARLRREIEKEASRVAALEEQLGGRSGAAADALTELAAEEAAAQREKVDAEASFMLASSQAEKLRAQLAAVTTAKAEAAATVERVSNQQGQYGARRMSLEAEIKRARDAIGPQLRDAKKRREDLEYRLRQLHAKHPGLKEGTTP